MTYTVINYFQFFQKHSCLFHILFDFEEIASKEMKKFEQILQNFKTAQQIFKILQLVLSFYAA